MSHCENTRVKVLGGTTGKMWNKVLHTAEMCDNETLKEWKKLLAQREQKLLSSWKKEHFETNTWMEKIFIKYWVQNWLLDPIS